MQGGRDGDAIGRTRPVLVINPATDGAFERVCRSAMRPPPTGPSDLQARLRSHYPQAVVRPRGLSGEMVVVWYVYREGHWVSSA
ncbi:MAG: hypothetical protein KF809_18470 [Chloroflexi bacterium]|nr:hypothetical protein [Chloroflexota bacterium]